MLKESALDFDKAITIATTAEATEKHVTTLASTRREVAAVEALGMQSAKDDNHVHHATQAEGTRTHRSTVEWQKIAGRKYPSTDKAGSCF